MPASESSARELRIVLLTLESLAAAEAVRRFAVEHRRQIVAVGISNPFRGPRGGMLKQTWQHLRRSGFRFLPYLICNFELPRWSRAGWALHRRGPIERTPIDVLCQRNGIPVIEIGDVNDAATHQALRAHGADLALSFHFDKILSAATIALFPLGAINVHAALLPKHRGPVPTVHALLEEKPCFGVTVHRVVPRIDAGAILAQAAVDLPASTSALAAARALHRAALPLLDRTLADLAAGRARESPVATAPYCGFPTMAELRSLARNGRRTANLRDVVRALLTPA